MSWGWRVTEPSTANPLRRDAFTISQQSRRVESELVAHIREVEARRLYAREASSTIYSYCTDVLHLSEHEAYLRIEVARASRKHPVLLEMLADGRLHLSGISLLRPHLTVANRETLLKRAVYKSKRQIQEIVAELSPRADIPATIRKLPERRVSTEPTRTAHLFNRSPTQRRHFRRPRAFSAVFNNLLSRPVLCELATL